MRRAATSTGPSAGPIEPRRLPPATSNRFSMSESPVTRRSRSPEPPSATCDSGPDHAVLPRSNLSSFARSRQGAAVYVRRLTVPRLIAGKLKVGFVVLILGAALLPSTRAARGDQPWVVYEGHDGPGRGKKVVFVSGDEEYRSEEGLPQLAKILAARHGFHCTVLFATDPKDGTINPNQSNNIPAPEAPNSAALLVIFTR